MRIIKKVSNWQEVKSYASQLLDNKGTSEKAKCAYGRHQLWLQVEPNYREKTYVPAITDERLWRFIKTMCPNADLAQVFGGNVAIDWHRDASYACQTAWLFSLGSSVFEVEGSGSLQLNGGELVEFNCKKLHRATSVKKTRVGIGIWQAKIPLK